jgi:SnoaL-like domain
VSPDRIRLRRLMDAQFDAWNRGDLDAAIATCADNVEYSDPNIDLVGADALREHLGAVFSRYRLNLVADDMFALDAADGTDGLMVCWTGTFAPLADGPTAEIRGIDLILFEGDLMVRNDVRFDRLPLTVVRRQYE